MTPERKAAFERLVDAFEVAVGRRAKRGVISPAQVLANRTAARANLTAWVEREIAEAQIENDTQVALAAIRMEAGRQERLGKVYEVEPVVGTRYSRPGVLFQLYEHKPGDRVRVVRVEDAAHPEEEK